MTNIDIYEAMSTQRAVRRLKPDPIPDVVLSRILQAATWAPSGGNAQPWRVIVVKDDALRAKLGDLYRPQWKKYEAGARKRIEHLTDDALARQERALDAAIHLGEHFGEAPLILVFCFNPDNMAITDAGLNRPTVVGGGSVYPAVQNALLACRVEGVGCTLTTLLCFCEDEVKTLLDIPADWYTCAFVPIGFPVLGGYGPTHRRSVAKLAFVDTWGNAG
ncbi:MAG: nitroreductase family protein [Gammaproteobacteria bacterium]|nr:nitroreductase family protein [Gammaproteobacteria bacterium]